MHLVPMDQDDLPGTDPGEPLQQLLDMGSALPRLGPAQPFLDLLPRPAGRTTRRMGLRPASRPNVGKAPCVSVFTVPLGPGKPCAAGAVFSTAATICLTGGSGKGGSGRRWGGTPGRRGRTRCPGGPP